MPRFLADGEGVTSCANNLVGKHLEFFFSRCTLDPINKKSVLSGLCFNFLGDIQEDTSWRHFVRISKEISRFFSERDKYILVSSALIAINLSSGGQRSGRMCGMYDNNRLSAKMWLRPKHDWYYLLFLPCLPANLYTFVNLLSFGSILYMYSWIHINRGQWFSPIAQHAQSILKK